MSYLVTRDPAAAHPLDAVLGAVEGEHAGLAGGLTEAAIAAEAARVGDLPVCGGESPLYEFADYDIEVDTSGLSAKEVPRHDRFANENSGVITERVIPGGVLPGHYGGGDEAEQAQAQAEAPAEAEGVLTPNTPAQSATKADWVAYVTTFFEVTTAEAEAMTKAELIDTYGA